MDNSPEKNINIDAAIRQYRKNKERALQYNKDHPEKCRIRQKRNYDKTKIESPEKYQAMLLKKNISRKKVSQNKNSIVIFKIP